MPRPKTPEPTYEEAVFAWAAAWMPDVRILRWTPQGWVRLDPEMGDILHRGPEATRPGED